MRTPVSTQDAISKEKHERLFRRGLKWIGVGGVFMGLSFALNVYMLSAGTSLTPVMYAVTTIGSLAILKGLVDILGF